MVWFRCYTLLVESNRCCSRASLFSQITNIFEMGWSHQPDWVFIGSTLPETNSSHPPGCAIPKGNDRLPTIHFQGRTVSFREGTPHPVTVPKCQIKVYRYRYPVLKISKKCNNPGYDWCMALFPGRGAIWWWPLNSHEIFWGVICFDPLPDEKNPVNGRICILMHFFWNYLTLLPTTITIEIIFSLVNTMKMVDFRWLCKFTYGISRSKRGGTWRIIPVSKYS